MRECLVRIGWSLLVLAATAIESAGDERSPALATFPVETVFRLTTENMAEFSAAWLQTPPGRTMVRPAVAAFRRQLEEEEVLSVLALRPLFGVDWSDLAQVSGRVTLAACPVSDTKLEAVLTVDAGTQEPAVQACQNAAHAYWMRRDFRHMQVSIGGRQVRHYRREVAGKIDERWMAATQRGFLVATGDKSLPKLLDDASDPVSAKSAGVKSTAKATDGLARCELRLQPLPLARHLNRAQPAHSRTVRAAERLRFDQVEEFHAEFVLDPTATSMIRMAGEIAIASPLEKAARLLDFPSAPQVLSIPVVSHGVDTVGSWRWNVRDAMSGLGNVLDEWMEPGPDGEGLFDDVLDALRDDPDGPQVNLRRELFEKIGPQVVSLSGFVRSGEPSRRTLFMIECRNKQAVRDSLTRMYRADATVHFADVSGHGFWWVDGAGSLFIDTESADMPVARAVAIGPKGFLLSTDADFLRGFLRVESDGPAESWNRLKRESAKFQQGNIGGQSLLLTKPRFEAAYVELAKGKPPAGPESAVLAALLLGSAADPAKRSSRLKMPVLAEIQSLFAPGWIHWRKEPKSLVLRAGFLAGETP